MAILTILALSPLVIPQGEFHPIFIHLPRTLWAGIIIYIFMILLTLIGTRVFKQADSAGSDTL